jgi:hypothetical protein
VVTVFTHNFLGISTSSVNIFTYSAAAIGAFYVVAEDSAEQSNKRWS